jgi:hypothetical protein
MIFIYKVNSNGNYIPLLNKKNIDVETFEYIKEEIKKNKNPVFYFLDLMIAIRIKNDIEYNNNDNDTFIDFIGDTEDTIENINDKKFIEKFNYILNIIMQNFKFRIKTKKSKKTKKTKKSKTKNQKNQKQKIKNHII